MTALLTRVRTSARLSAHARAWQLLHGAFASVHHERSLDLADLREYVPGDDPRDIDWRATARTPTTLIRRTVATRRHQVWLVVDTGRSMTGHNARGVPKRDVAVTAAGVLGSIACDQGDVVGLVSGDRAGARAIPPGSGDSHLERLLRQIHRTTSPEAAPTSPARCWSTTAAVATRPGVVVIVTDDHELGPTHADLLRRLRARHTVLHVCVDDVGLDSAAVGAGGGTDVTTGRALPRSVMTDARLATQMRESTDRRRAQTRALLNSCAVTHARITHPDAVVRTLLDLLHRHAHVC